MTSEKSRGERKSWITGRVQALTCLELPLRHDIENDSSLDWARAPSRNRNVSGSRRATSEGEPRPTPSKKRTQPGSGGGVSKRTKTESKPSTPLAVIPETVSGEAGVSAPGVFQPLGQASGPSFSATLPGQHTHQPTHAILGNGLRDPFSHDTLLPFPAQLATSPVTTHLDFLHYQDPALIGDLHQQPASHSHAPTAPFVPWNSSGKLPERTTTMQAPSLSDHLELWRFGGPADKILCSTMLDPTCPFTMIPPGILNGLGFYYPSDMLHSGIFPIPGGPVTVGNYTVTDYVRDLCIFPSGDDHAIRFDAYVLPLPDSQQRPPQEYTDAWCQNHIIMGTTLHGMLANYPRQSITAHPGNT